MTLLWDTIVVLGLSHALFMFGCEYGIVKMMVVGLPMIVILQQLYDE
jgi:predicted metal-binding membrane protein